jgi:hypothetical protein
MAHGIENPTYDPTKTVPNAENVQEVPAVREEFADKVSSTAKDGSTDGAVERGYSNPMFNVSPPACISTVPVNPLQDLTYGVEGPVMEGFAEKDSSTGKDGSSPDGAIERGYSNPMFNVSPPACISTVPVNPLQDLTYGVEVPVMEGFAEKDSSTGKADSPDGAVERGYSNPMFNVSPPACISTVPVNPLQDLTYGVENPLYQEQVDKTNDVKQGTAVEEIIKIDMSHHEQKPDRATYEQCSYEASGKETKCDTLEDGKIETVSTKLEDMPTEMHQTSDETANSNRENMLQVTDIEVANILKGNETHNVGSGPEAVTITMETGISAEDDDNTGKAECAGETLTNQEIPVACDSAEAAEGFVDDALSLDLTANEKAMTKIESEDMKIEAISTDEQDNVRSTVTTEDGETGSAPPRSCLGEGEPGAQHDNTEASATEPNLLDFDK